MMSEPTRAPLPERLHRSLAHHILKALGDE